MSSSGLRLVDLLIPLEEIRSATKDFSKETLIVDSFYSKVYKVQFTKRLQNCTAEVKHYESRSDHGKEDFLNELNLIHKFHHENIIPFIGYCDEGDEMIIVSEYAIKGRLADYLWNPNKRLSMTWPQRLKICLGAAKAINYLHLGLSEDYVVIHGNIKSNAILLDENLEAKIGYFASSIEVGRNQQHIYKSFTSIGFYIDSCYIDPIYQESGILKTEAYVYSFGVVMFELLSGTPASHHMVIGDDHRLPLINFVRHTYDTGELEKLIDSQIRDQIDRRSLDTFAEIAYRCISYNLNGRPLMHTVVKRITEALDIHNHAAASTITIRSHLHQNLENLLIPLEEIRLATGDFSPENNIEGGGFGTVYKGQLSGRWENRTAAFKRQYPESDKGEGFRNELQMTSSLRHENINQLIGYCDEGSEMIIVYDYAVNGSLDLNLEDESKRRCLTWVQRLKICIGAAIGLKHLQASQEGDKILVHINFKSSKILLDDNMESLINVSRFSMVVDRNKGQLNGNSSINNVYYTDPIYRQSGINKSETDVYSLGMVLFETFSGMSDRQKRRIGNDEPRGGFTLCIGYASAYPM